MNRINIAGMSFGRVTAVCDVGQVRSGDRKWRFECACGLLFECSGYAVRIGRVTSCPSCSSKRTKAASITHGLSRTREFSTWTDIQTRCHNSKATSYPKYGGRGIVVCASWRESFESFFADMGPRPSSRHSIERNDVNGNYEPANCRWATDKEQANNKRSNRRVTIYGRTQNMQEWADEASLTAATLRARLEAGKTGDALLAPSRTGGVLEFNGVIDTYAGWSQRTGIKLSTIAMRLTKYQWSIEKSLTQGASL